jgi:glycosyltransferase involved in cell wall biosynthesis
MGRLAPEKCPGLLLHAVAYIYSAMASTTAAQDLEATPEEVRDFTTSAVIDVYGDGPLRSDLERLASLLGVDGLVRFRGELRAEAEVQRVMLHSDVLVNPRLPGETFGFVHLEAASVGLPVIAFRTGGNEETVSGGLLVDYIEGRAVEQLAYALLLAFRRRKEPLFNREDICLRAKSRVAQWSVRRHSHSLMDVVREALQHRGRKL